VATRLMDFLPFPASKMNSESFFPYTLWPMLCAVSVGCGGSGTDLVHETNRDGEADMVKLTW
jgi:hypothetical protein